MKTYKCKLMTRGGHCTLQIRAESYEEAVKLAREKWKGCLIEVVK